MQSLEAAVEDANNLLYNAKKCVPHVNENITNGKHHFSIYEKLVELKKEERLSCFKKRIKIEEQPNIVLSNPHLIEKLVTKEHLNTLVISLFAKNEGYSLAVKTSNSDIREKKVTEAMRFPCLENDLLDYIDSGHIPPMFSDLLEEIQPSVYYGGCVIAEVCDYRHPTENTCKIYHTLLTPTTQTIINDVNVISENDSMNWSIDDKLSLESMLIFANNGPLCLEPKPSLCIAMQKLSSTKNSLNNTKLKNTARRYSAQGISRQKSMTAFTQLPSPLKYLHKHVNQKRINVAQEKKPTISTSFKQQQQNPMKDEFWINASARIIEQAKLMKNTTDSNSSCSSDSSLKLVEQYILQTKETRLLISIKLSIFQRSCDSEFVGEINYNNELAGGKFYTTSARFPLGSKAFARRYIMQYIDILTEHGKNQIKITVLAPGYPAQSTTATGLQVINDKLIPINSTRATTPNMRTFPWKVFERDRENLCNTNDEYVKKLLTDMKINRSVLQLKSVSTNSSNATATDAENVTNNMRGVKNVQNLHLCLQQHFNNLLQQKQQPMVRKQLRQQLSQASRLLESVQIRNERQAIAKLKAQIQEHRQMQQAAVVNNKKVDINAYNINHSATANGLIPQKIPNFASTFKQRTDLSSSSPTPQVITVQKFSDNVVTSTPNTALNKQFQTSNNAASGNLTKISNAAISAETNEPVVVANNHNNRTILNLLSNASAAQSSSSSTSANITLNSLLTSSVGTIRSQNQPSSLNLAGQQRIFARRFKSPTAKLISTSSGVPQHISPAVSANSAGSVNSVQQQQQSITISGTSATTTALTNHQPLVRVSIESLPEQLNLTAATQKSPKVVTSGISNIKNASLGTLITNVTPNSVPSSNNIHIGQLIMNDIQSLLISNNSNNNSNIIDGAGSSSVSSPASNIRIRTGKVNSSVTVPNSSTLGGILTSGINVSQNHNNGDALQTDNSASSSSSSSKIQTLPPELSSGTIQTMIGTLTAAPTIARTVQLVSRNIIPSSSNIQIANATNKELSNLQMNGASIDIGEKTSQIIRLAPAGAGIVQATPVSISRNAITTYLSSDDAVFENNNSSSSPINSVVIGVNNTTAASETVTSHTTTQQLNSTIVNIADLADVTSHFQNLQHIGNLSALPNSIGTPIILTTASRGERPNGHAKTAVQKSSLINPNSTVQLINSGQRSKITQLPKQNTVQNLLTNRMKVTVPPNAVVQPCSSTSNSMLTIAAAQQQLQLVLQKQSSPQLLSNDNSSGESNLNNTSSQISSVNSVLSPIKVALKRRRSSTMSES